MSRWYSGSHRQNGHSGRSDRSPDIHDRRLEAEKALRDIQKKKGEVDTVAHAMRLLRETDNFSKLFGDALGGV